jgi:TDG/mug DNA glycosylase family protein
MTHVIHEIPPVYNKNSEILILGSFPSVKSREGQFFYHHKQNRFWKVLSAVVNDVLPETVDEKKEFLLRNHIAVWDVIASCDIEGSSDSSIKNAVPNNFSDILKAAPIRQIYTNGGTAYKLYHKYCEKMTGIKAVKLPSTSPANASYSLDRLIGKWKIIDDQMSKH